MADWPTPVTPGGEPDANGPAPEPAPVQQQSGGAPGQGFTITDLRRLWPEVLEEVKNRRRFTWILLSQNAHVADLTNGTVVLAMPNAGARDSFARGGSEDILRDALVAVIGADLKIETMVDPSAGGSTGRGTRTSAPGPSVRSADASGSMTGPAGAAPTVSGTGRDIPAGTSSPVGRSGPSSGAVPGSPPSPAGPQSGSGGQAAADPPPWATDDSPQRPTGAQPSWAADRPPADEWEVRDAAADRDDEVLDDAGVSHTELLQQRLGAEIIAEEESGA